MAGALMAGTRAGYLYPTFPKMAGELVPSSLFAVDPWPASLWRDLATIHFVHRWSGIAIALMALAGLAAAVLRPAPSALRGAASLVAALAATTAALGVFTVTSGVAIVPAVVHQLLAVALLGAAILAQHRAVNVERSALDPRAGRYGETPDQAVG